MESLYAFLAKVEAMVAKGEQACMMLQVRPGVTRQLPLVTYQQCMCIEGPGLQWSRHVDAGCKAFKSAVAVLCIQVDCQAIGGHTCCCAPLPLCIAAGGLPSGEVQDLPTRQLACMADQPDHPQAPGGCHRGGGGGCRPLIALTVNWPILTAAYELSTAFG